MSRDEYYGCKETQCPFIVFNKERPCRKDLFRRPDGSKSKYCIVHAYVDTPDIKFVTCPFEPKFSMPEYMLAAHVEVCPKAMQLKAIHEQPFYSKGINVMNPDLADGFTELGKRKKGKYIEKLHAEIASSHANLEESKDDPLQQKEEQEEKEDIPFWIEFIKKAYNSLRAKYGASHPPLFKVEEQVAEMVKFNEGRPEELTENMKHGNQQTNIVKYMEQSGLLRCLGTTF